MPPAENLVRVKICGMTRAEDVRHAAASGADAVGVVFARSPRRMEPGAAADLAREVPEDVDLFGLFVDSPVQDIVETAREVGLDVVQLHGSEPPEFLESLAGELGGVRLVKAVRVRGPESIDEARGYGGAWAVLLDAYVEGVKGGTGESFEWDLAVGLAAERAVILAGGLGPSNVAEAVRAVGPMMVDVSSGVESAPGVKDPRLVERFIAEAKGALG